MQGRVSAWVEGEDSGGLARYGDVGTGVRGAGWVYGTWRGIEKAGIRGGMWEMCGVRSRDWGAGREDRGISEEEGGPGMRRMRRCRGRCGGSWSLGAVGTHA